MLKCERGGGTDKALERCNTCTHTHTHAYANALTATIALDTIIPGPTS